MSSDQLPSGNVTFFFSDIESSTELWDGHQSHRAPAGRIPLAIELAAARLRLMTPQQLADRLDDRFRLLTGGSCTALPRQQMLRALIDWSYSLLEPAEKLLFRHLSVFKGGWSLAAAEAVASSADLADHDTLDLLSRLIDKSLVVMEEDDGNEVDD